MSHILQLAQTYHEHSDVVANIPTSMTAQLLFDRRLHFAGGTQRVLQCILTCAWLGAGNTWHVLNSLETMRPDSLSARMRTSKRCSAGCNREGPSLGKHCRMTSEVVKSNSIPRSLTFPANHQTWRWHMLCQPSDGPAKLLENSRFACQHQQALCSELLLRSVS